MFYTKLHSIYSRTDCPYPLPLLQELNDFILNERSLGRNLVSPYRFALRAGIEVRETIQFFMYFAQTDGIFNIRFFFECSQYSCGERIFLDSDVINNPDKRIVCEECGKAYYTRDFIPFIKLYFELKPECLIPDTPQFQHRTDPNSTIQALQGVPSHLKVQSPSSCINSNLRTGDEGDDVHIKTVTELNVRSDGSPILNIGILTKSASFIRGV